MKAFAEVYKEYSKATAWCRRPVLLTDIVDGNFSIRVASIHTWRTVLPLPFKRPRLFSDLNSGGALLLDLPAPNILSVVHQSLWSTFDMLGCRRFGMKRVAAAAADRSSANVAPSSVLAGVMLPSIGSST